MTREENYVEHLLQVGEGLRGLSLQQLGFQPNLEDQPETLRRYMGPQELERWGSITQEQRDRSLFQAKLLAGALWEASVILIDQLFEDLASLRKLHGQAQSYDIDFVQRFIVVAANMTGALARRWDRTSCPAEFLAVLCLLYKVEDMQDSYHLDLADDWWEKLELELLDFYDYEPVSDIPVYHPVRLRAETQIKDMLFGLAPSDVPEWFEPYDDASVPPFVPRPTGRLSA